MVGGGGVLVTNGRIILILDPENSLSGTGS